jgi:hypothetical protein
MRHPKKQPMERSEASHEASCGFTAVYPPYTFVVAFSSRDGIAGLLKPMTDPFKRQPNVAQRVASTCFLLL